MKQYYKHIFRLTFVVILLSSCNKYLDVKPKGQVIPATLDDYIALLSAPLPISSTATNQLYLTDEIYLPEEFRASANSYLGKAAVNAYDFADALYDTGEDDVDWNTGYKTLYVCNTILTGLPANTETDIAKRNQAEGEARVHRAFTYLSLVNEYANHYNPATAATDPGVPLVTKPDINALPARASVKEVYALIEQDLLQAVKVLADKSDYTYRPSKAAAYGVLARMYLYMGNWQQSYEYADKALQLKNFSYDYNTFSWKVPAKKSGLTGYPSTSIDVKDIVFLKYLRSVGGYQFTILFSPAQMNLFKAGDLRNEFGSTTLGYYGETLPAPGILETGSIYNYNRTGITNGELLVTRAEAQARLGNTNVALEDLNYLRKKRFTPATYADLTASTPAAALDLALNERRIELAFLGLRLADIKRLNLEGRNISVQHGDKILKAGDPRFVLPIAQKILDLNPNIKQNQR